MDILNGIRIGQFDFDIDAVITEIKWRCLDTGMNYVAFSAGGEKDCGMGKFKNENKEEKFLGVVKYLVNNEIYFTFTNGGGGSFNEPYFGFEKETFSKVKKMAGDYYVGNLICEPGGYWSNGCDYLKRRFKGNLLEAKDGFINELNMRIANSQLPEETKKDTAFVEALPLLSYVAESDAAFPVLETMPANPEIMIPLLRGTAKAYNKERFLTYIAHECYGGLRWDDNLKAKRLQIVYNFAYLCGSMGFLLESGDLGYRVKREEYGNVSVELGENNFDFAHPVSQNYRDVLRSFSKFMRNDHRPEGGPKVKVAFVQGNLDSWSSFNPGSSVWNRYDDPAYGYSAPEYTWKLMDDINIRRPWYDAHNYGEIDLSGAPAYGQYDIINASVSLEALKKYDCLIFTGWNTMTPEIYSNLVEYVKQGGRVLMTAAHLDTSVTRGGDLELINNGNVEELFGCKLNVDESFTSNCGFKFNESLMENVLYPVDRNYDSNFASGYAKYAKTELCGGVVASYLSQAYSESENSDGRTAMVEHRLGKGCAILVTGIEYPGNGPLYSMYKAVVRELMTASHRECDVKVYGNDRLRFSVYEGNKVYLLNTDFDNEIIVTVDKNGNKEKVTLEPGELKSV